MANYYYSSQPTLRGLPDGPLYPQDPFTSSQTQGSLYRSAEPYRDYPQNEGDRRNLKDDSSFNSMFKPTSSFDHPESEWVGTGVKAYRKGIRRQDLWTRGGGLLCFGRFFFCTLMIIIYIVVAIILGFALWLRPPALSFTGPGLNPTQQVSFPDSTLTVPLEMNITVNNPDFFAVDFKALTAQVSYPSVNNTVVANGNLTNLLIKSDQITNFTFPIVIYLDLSSSAPSNDNLAVVLDLAEKCGLFSSNSPVPIPLDIKIGIDLSLLGISVTLPSVSFPVNINCPIDDSAIEQKLQGILGAL